MEGINVSFFIVFAVSLAIGIFVIATLFQSVPATNDSAANEAVTKVKNNTWTAFGLLAVLLIVLAAWAILRVVRT